MGGRRGLCSSRPRSHISMSPLCRYNCVRDNGNTEDPEMKTCRIHDHRLDGDGEKERELACVHILYNLVFGSDWPISTLIKKKKKKCLFNILIVSYRHK